MVARHGGMVPADWLDAASGDRRGDRLRRCYTACGPNCCRAISPPGVPGYGTAPGVTVASRVRPDFDPPGVRVGSFLLRPQWAEGLGYDDNVFGSSGGGRGSWLVGTHPSLLIGSDWSRNSLGGYVGVDDLRYLDQPRQSQTNWTAVAGWRAVDRARPADRVGGASRPAPGADRARCAAVGYAGRLSRGRYPHRLHDRAGPVVGDAERGVLGVPLRCNDDPRRAGIAGLSRPRRGAGGGDHALRAVAEAQSAAGDAGAGRTLRRAAARRADAQFHRLSGAGGDRRRCRCGVAVSRAAGMGGAGVPCLAVQHAFRRRWRRRR